MKYFLYARKSTESEDRQILSIEAQLIECREYAKKENLTVIREYCESQSAKQPGRPIFNEVIARIEQGEAEGIVAWNPDRLARNSIDGGRVIYQVDTGKIKDLKFPTFRFDNNAYGKFILTIAFGQSKYYTDNLSENIKRGIRLKLRKGIWPQLAPLGYLNDHKTKAIIVDEAKATIIKQAFELYSTGKYSLKHIREYFLEKNMLGRRDKKLSIANVQYILKNPIYYGVIRYKREIYEGSHVPIISKSLYDTVQRTFEQRHRKTRKKKYSFVFRGLMKCVECGAMITADIKRKRYVYYHCTKRKGKCSQPFNTTEQDLAGQISSRLSEIWLNDITAEKIKDDLSQYRHHEDSELAETITALENELKELDVKLDRLLDGYVNGLIAPEEYQPKKEVLVEKKVSIKERLANLRASGMNWFELASNIINSCNSIKKVIVEQDYPEMVKISEKTGSNFILMNNRLSFDWKEPYDIITETRNSPPRELRQGVEFKQGCLNSMVLLPAKKNLKDFPANAVAFGFAPHAAPVPKNISHLFLENGLRPNWRRERDLTCRSPRLRLVSLQARFAAAGRIPAALSSPARRGETVQIPHGQILNFGGRGI